MADVINQIPKELIFSVDITPPSSDNSETVKNVQYVLLTPAKILPCRLVILKPILR